MSRIDEHNHGSRRLHRALGLGLSGAALVGLIYFEGASARAGAEEADASEALALEELADEADEVEEDAEKSVENVVPTAIPAPLPPSGPASAPAVPAGDVVALAELPATEAAAATPVAPLAPALVTVPDIEGMSLRKAKKQLAALGLKLAVRDEYGDRLPREIWHAYKVGSQKLDAGTEVEPGATVKVKARMRPSYAMGY